MQKIILASGSLQRKNILSVLNIPFEVIPADIDEKTIQDNDLKIRAEKIARAKAEKVASQHSGIIISGDTYTVCDGKILEKPDSLGAAKVMLRFLSGKKGINYNGFCYLDKKNKIDFSTTAEVKFAFRQLSELEIETYVKKFPVLTWAAACSPAYPYIMTMISYLTGSLTGFTHGLPMESLIPLLRKSGFDARP